MSTHADAARNRPVFPRLSRLRTVTLRQVDDRTVSGLVLLLQNETAMKDVVTISPLAGDPGLIAYECPECGHLTSVLVPPNPR